MDYSDMNNITKLAIHTAKIKKHKLSTDKFYESYLFKYDSEKAIAKNDIEKLIKKFRTTFIQLENYPNSNRLKKELFILLLHLYYNLLKFNIVHAEDFKIPNCKKIPLLKDGILSSIELIPKSFMIWGINSKKSEFLFKINNRDELFCSKLKEFKIIKN